jgi:hypothetical protein
MVELSVIRDLLAIFGVIAGFSYYVLTVRNANHSSRYDRAVRLMEEARVDA